MSVSENKIQINNLIEENMVLVEIIVKACIKKYPVLVLDYDEMVSIGYVALCHCARQYDPQKAQFNTYLTSSVEKRLLYENRKEIRNRNTIVSNSEEVEYLLEVADAYEGTGIIPGVDETIEAKDAMQRICEKLNVIIPGKLPYEVLFDRMEEDFYRREIARMYNKSPATMDAQVKKLRHTMRIYPKMFQDSPLEMVAKRARACAK